MKLGKLVFLILFFAQTGFAINFEFDDPKPRLAPLNLPDGSKLTLISPDEWTPLAEKLSNYLYDTHTKYEKIFGALPTVNTTLRLVDEEQFYAKTGAPAWANAIYYKGEITVPLALSKDANKELDQSIDIDNLYRSIKHEYTHVVISAMSKSKCPGWLDEGIAQLAEGVENPALTPSLKSWIKQNPPLPLDILQGGFTKLDQSMVPPAYAQSLYAAQDIVKTYGFSSLRIYFDNLKDGKTKAESFKHAFGISEKNYEQRLGISLKRWVQHSHSQIMR